MPRKGLTAGGVAQQFLTAVADEVTSRLASPAASTFSRQHLANLIWAYATLEVQLQKDKHNAVACVALVTRLAE